MHRALWLALLVGLTWSLTVATNARADWLERKWTNNQGKSITATFIRSTPTMALLNQNGKVIRVPLVQLNEADRQWIEAAEELKKMRQWVLSDGVSHRARLQDIQGETITLEVRSDKIELAVSQLIPDDQALIAIVSPPSPARGFSSPSTTTAGASGSRTWTDKSGKKIDAEYRGVEGDKVVLYFRDKEWRVPLDDLSIEDQHFVERQQGPAGIAGGQSPDPRSLADMTQEERINELLRQHRERSQQIAQNQPTAPPAHQAPSHSPQPPEPRFPEPRGPQTPGDQFGPPSIAHDYGPRNRGGWNGPTREEVELPTPQPIYQEVIICQGCRYENPAATFKAGDKCRGCGHRIDIIQNSDGSTRSQSASYSGRKIGRMITGVAALIGLLCGAVKKMMG